MIVFWGTQCCISSVVLGVSIIGVHPASELDTIDGRMSTDESGDVHELPHQCHFTVVSVHSCTACMYCV